MMRAHGPDARRPIVLPGLVAAITFATVSACGGNEEAAGEHEHGSVVITQWNDSTELFLEYPHLLAGEATGNWAIHLSSMKDFKPIVSGTLTVRFLSAEGAAETFTIDSVARDGIFLLDPVIARAGTYQVELALQSPQVNSRHMLPEVRVFTQEDEVPHAEEEEGGGIAFLKEQQWQIGWEVMPASEDTVQSTIAAPGEVVAPDGALVEISAPMDGIAAAAANRGAPSVGQSVRQGQVLVVLSPTAQDGGFAQARSRLDRLEREVERDERLHAAGAIPQRRLEEARHDLEVARAEVNAMGAGGVGGDYRLRLTSPVNGVVARRSFVPGGRVEAGTPLFTIVDPRTAWLRVQVPAAAVSGIPASAHATFTTDGSQEIHAASRLVSVGSVLDPRTRTVPVVFEIADAGGLFTFGQLAQVAVPTGGTVTGVVIPNRAIVDDNGTAVAYVQVGGETFERRVLSLGASDGVRTHVVAGIRSGEMVVTIGAYQVRLASMSGDDFAGGHAH
jgi:cobalt-zinc-cadmium efflux system membrane fusion protein